MESEEYKGLISPDAYEYLELTPEEELLHDPYLDEQDQLSDAFGDVDDDLFESPEEEVLIDDSDQYSYSSLFDEADEEESLAAAARHEEEPEEEPEPLEVYQVYDQDEDAAPVLPRLINSIVSILPSCACSSYLCECDSERQESIAKAISTAISSCHKDGKDKMFTIPGTSISIAVVTPSDDPMIRSQRIQSIAAVMVFHEAVEWTGLFITADEKDNITGAWVNEIKKEDFSPWQWRTITMNAERMKSRK